MTRLGGDALAVFPVGGPSGEMLSDLLTKEQISCSTIPISGVTRQSFTVDERKSGAQYRFVLPGPQLSTAEQTQCLDQLAALNPVPAILVVSGSLPPAIAPDFLKQLGQLCARTGARLIIDTSAEALKQATDCGIYMLKPNLRELEALTGLHIHGEAGEVKAARLLITQGLAEVIVLSLGARGALLVTGDSEERFAAIDVPIQSAVGAGDSMVAAMVLGLTRDLPLREAVRFGLAAGAAALITPGTELARREDVERLYVIET
ncbi:1-phosphofructokinase family hexose kinase [Rhizorhapis sp. SPR117]|nr:1-phosphofructokinase family hexose kinase [Rhizorhapis sp. SPR117]